MTMSVASEAVKQLEELGYKVGKVVINAADFGVPQVRKRVILFSIREDFCGEMDVAGLLTDILSEVGMEQRAQFGLATDRYVNVGEAISDLAGGQSPRSRIPRV